MERDKKERGERKGEEERREQTGGKETQMPACYLSDSLCDCRG